MRKFKSLVELGRLAAEGPGMYSEVYGSTPDEFAEFMKRRADSMSVSSIMKRTALTFFGNVTRLYEAEFLSTMEYFRILTRADELVERGKQEEAALLEFFEMSKIAFQASLYISNGIYFDAGKKKFCVDAENIRNVLLKEAQDSDLKLRKRRFLKKLATESSDERIEFAVRGALKSLAAKLVKDCGDIEIRFVPAPTKVYLEANYPDLSEKIVNSLWNIMDNPTGSVVYYTRQTSARLGYIKGFAEKYGSVPPIISIIQKQDLNILACSLILATYMLGVGELTDEVRKDVADSYRSAVAEFNQELPCSDGSSYTEKDVATYNEISRTTLTSLIEHFGVELPPDMAPAVNS